MSLLSFSQGEENMASNKTLHAPFYFLPRVKRIGPPTKYFLLYFISSQAEENRASNNTLHALFYFLSW